MNKNLWDECYSGDATKNLNPAQFKQTFCDHCQNVECENSRVNQSKWAHRMATQADVLLNNPRFADMDDPMFRDIRTMNFEDRVREALAVEITTRKNDWSIPSETEVAAMALEVMGGPAFFVPKSDPPEPPTNTPKVVVEDAPVEAESERLGQWVVRGDTPNSKYTVEQNGEVWTCTCPAFVHHKKACKHIQGVLLQLSRQPAPAPAPPKEAEGPLREPGSLAWGQAFASRGIPRMQNTHVPSEGIMVGGRESPVTPPAADPWAAPAPPPTRTVQEFIIPVGGKIVMGTGKHKA
jgi:hypothetical protein